MEARAESIVAEEGRSRVEGVGRSKLDWVDLADVGRRGVRRIEKNAATGAEGYVMMNLRVGFWNRVVWVESGGRGAGRGKRKGLRE